MEGEAHEEIERHPRQIEQGRWPAAGEKGADLVEIAQRLLPVALGASHDRRAELAVEDLLTQILVQGRSDAGEDAAAEHVEQTLEEIEHDDDDGEADQRRNAPARQDPVIDLHHEDRAGQVEQVDQAAEHGDAQEGTATGGHDAEAFLEGAGHGRCLERLRRFGQAPRFCCLGSRREHVGG